MTAAGVVGAPSESEDDLFLQHLAWHLVHAVPSLRHSHWERGSLEHLAWREQEQQVPSKGKVLRGVRSTCWRFRRRGLGLMLVLPSSSLWRLPVAMSTLTGGAFVGAPTLGGAGTQILTEFVLLAPGVRGERLLVWGPVNMLHMLKNPLTLEACGLTMA